MAKVEVIFEAELPFWLAIDDGKYDINIDGKIWPIELYNDKWRIAMDNDLDGKGETIAIAKNMEAAKKIHEIFKEKKYYHKEKLKTVITTGFSWTMEGSITKEEAKEKFKKEFNWCQKTYLDRINRLIEIYKISEASNHVPYILSFFDLSRNWWYSILLNGEWIEGGRVGYNINTDIRKPPHILSSAIQQNIIDKLKLGNTPPPSLLMLFNAVGLHERGRYENSLVEITSSFDIFLVGFLRINFEKKGYDEDLIKYLISCCNNFNFMLKKGLKLAVGKSFGEIDNKLYERFKNDVLRLRNDVIHRGKKISEKESIEAIKIINIMINKIKDSQKK